ncbi:MAG: hypothetical protein HY940_05620 [Gammaproteobacteria bacterium]|nr:hypothetical protein [Gammaproteobacteria bacterium]
MYHRSDRRRYAFLLSILLAMFSLRVIGQLIQITSPVDFLPLLESWQGSDLPYTVLLSSQLVIIVLVTILAFRIHAGSLIPRRRLGKILWMFGILYFVIMFARLILGVTVLADYPWFAKPVPAIFHLVLSGMVLTLGHYHCHQQP